MKTLEDLVKKLNETDEGEGYYKLSEYPEGTFRVCYKLANQEWSITAFGKSSKKNLTRIKWTYYELARNVLD